MRESIAGIINSKAKVVRSLSTANDDFKPNYRRINRRLEEVDLTEAYEEPQRRAFEEISDDTVIAIDPDDIAKPYSKTLECLAKVADGSDDHRIKPCYRLLSHPSIDHVIPFGNSRFYYSNQKIISSI